MTADYQFYEAAEQGTGTARGGAGPDTPGPNEAKAAAALQKIGPQVMNMSSGCIFCIPHDQVESEQMEKLYSHINIYMGGKAVNHGF